MAINFPHLTGDIAGYPGPGRELYEQIPGAFDPTLWTEGTQIVLLSVPWGIYTPNVSDAVPGFDSIEERDRWFTEHIEGGSASGTEAHILETPVRVQFDAFIDLPFTFDYAAKYNYLIVKYGNAPVTNGTGGVSEWFYHVVGYDYSSPSCTRVKLVPDYWTTFAPAVTIEHMILERGHYPVAKTNVKNYLANPIANNAMLLAPDVDYGDDARMSVSHFTDHFFNDDNLLAVLVVKDADIHGIEATSDGEPYVLEYPSTTIGAFSVSSKAYAIDPDSLPSVINYIDDNNPLFFEYIEGVYFVKADLLNLGHTVSVAGFSFREVEGGAQISINDTLAQSDFGYDSKYADLAKLYTYPYAHIEIASTDGSVTEIRIENLSGNGTQMVAALNFIYPSLKIDTRVNNYGGSRRTVYFGDVSSQIGGAWQLTEHQLDIPMYGIYVPQEALAEYKGYYGRENDKNNAEIDRTVAKLRATNAKSNSDMETTNTYTNATTSATTSRDNALRSNTASYNNAIRSADASLENSNRSATNSRDNSYASAANSRDNSVRDYTNTRTNALASNATNLSNATDSANTNYSNAIANADAALASGNNATNANYEAQGYLNTSRKTQTNHANAIALNNLDNLVDANTVSYELIKRNSLQGVIQQYCWDMYEIDHQEDKALAIFDINAQMERDITDSQVTANTISTVGNVLGNAVSTAGSIGGEAIMAGTGSAIGGMATGNGIAGGNSAASFLGSTLSSAVTTAAYNQAMRSQTDIKLSAQEGTITVSAQQDRHLAQQKAAFNVSDDRFPTDLTQPWFNETDSRFEDQLTVNNGIYQASNALTLATSVDNAKNTIQASEDNAQTMLTALNVNNETLKTAELQNQQRTHDTSATTAAATRDTAIGNAGRSKTTSDTIANNNFGTSETNTGATYDTDYANATRSYNAATSNNSKSYDTSTANASTNKSTSDKNTNDNYSTDTGNAKRSRDAGMLVNSNNYATANKIADLIYEKNINSINASYNDTKIGAPTLKGSNKNTESVMTRPLGLTVNVVTEDRSAIAQAAAHFKRYGYALNQSADFTTWNVMQHFSYWKVSDIWLTGIDTAPEEAQDAIRAMLYNGVTAWRTPDDIGKVGIYDN